MSLIFQKLALISALFFAESSVLAASEVSLADLKKIQDKLQLADTFTADFNQTVFRKLRHREVKSRGTATFGRPNLFRWVIHEPTKLELIYNGTELVQYEPDEKLALKLSTANAKRRELEDITSAAVNLGVLLDRYRLDRAIREGTTVVLSLSPRSESEISGVNISINTQDNFVQEVKLQFKDGQSNTIVFSTPKSITRQPELFSFLPPKDVKINEIK